VDVDGKTYAGSYERVGNWITVHYYGRSKGAQLSGHRSYPDQLAFLLLSEMFRDLPD
jgi:hypothetical protein